MDTGTISSEQESREIYSLLRTAGHKTLVAFRRFSEPPHDLSLRKAQALLHLHATDSAASVNELAKVLCSSVGWASRVTEVLRNQCLVDCIRDRPDRRVVHVKLTEKGTRIARELWAELCNPFADALGEVFPQEQRVIKQFLRQFTVKLNRPSRKHRTGRTRTKVIP